MLLGRSVVGMHVGRGGHHLLVPHVRGYTGRLILRAGDKLALPRLLRLWLGLLWLWGLLLGRLWLWRLLLLRRLLGRGLGILDALMGADGHRHQVVGGNHTGHTWRHLDHPKLDLSRGSRHGGIRPGGRRKVGLLQLLRQDGLTRHMLNLHGRG